MLGQQNDWTTTFAEFSDEIKKEVDIDINKVIVDDSSVATQNSIIVSQIAVMESMKSYFSYQVSTLCGIPRISLLGATDDWKNLKEKVNILCRLNENDRLKLDFWLKHLTPIVDKIFETVVNKHLIYPSGKNLQKRLEVAEVHTLMVGLMYFILIYYHIMEDM